MVTPRHDCCLRMGKSLASRAAKRKPSTPRKPLSAAAKLARAAASAGCRSSPRLINSGNVWATTACGACAALVACKAGNHNEPSKGVSAKPQAQLSKSLHGAHLGARDVAKEE